MSKADLGLAKIDMGDKKWHFLLTWYCNHVPPDASRLVRRVLDRLVDFDSCELETIDYLSFVSDTVKAEFSGTLGTIGRYLVDIKVIGGYSTYLNTVDPVEPWFEKSVERRRIGFGDQFELLREHVDRAIRDIKFGCRKKSGELSVAEFVANRGYWDGSGAALGVSFPLMVNGKKVKLRTKAGAMLKYSDDEIIQIMRDREIVSATFQKSDEPVKARIIQNVSMNSYCVART